MARKPARLVAAVLDEPMLGEPDNSPPDAPAPALITFMHECPDCDWCSGQVAVLFAGGETVAVGYDPDLEVGDLPYLVVGRDLKQVGFSGLSTRKGEVHVGHPPHPAYVAVNLAFQAGETAVEIHGASPGLQERIGGDLDRVRDQILVIFT